MIPFNIRWTYIKFWRRNRDEIFIFILSGLMYMGLFAALCMALEAYK